MRAIEVVGTVEEERRVRMGQPVPADVGEPVRLIILIGKR
jgi:hypothetical protein